MKIIFANQKGGCGKTTNCIQFANVLAQQGKDVILLDIDFQKSISDRRNADMEELSATNTRSDEENTFDNEIPYEVIGVDSERISDVFQEIDNYDNNTFILVDMPGRIDDEGQEFILILQSADVIIIPFNYDKLTLDSTGFFIQLLQHLKNESVIKAKIVFLPNKVKNNVKYDTLNDANEILSQFGIIAPPISDRVAMERLSTLGISDEAFEIVDKSYKFIINEIIKN